MFIPAFCEVLWLQNESLLCCEAIVQSPCHLVKPWFSQKENELLHYFLGEILHNSSYPTNNERPLSLFTAPVFLTTNHWEPATSAKYLISLSEILVQTQWPSSGLALIAAPKYLTQGSSAGYTLSRLTQPCETAVLWIYDGTLQV